MKKSNSIFTDCICVLKINVFNMLAIKRKIQQENY